MDNLTTNEVSISLIMNEDKELQRIDREIQQELELIKTKRFADVKKRIQAWRNEQDIKLKIKLEEHRLNEQRIREKFEKEADEIVESIRKSQQAEHLQIQEERQKMFQEHALIEKVNLLKALDNAYNNAEFVLSTVSDNQLNSVKIAGQICEQAEKLLNELDKEIQTKNFSSQNLSQRVLDIIPKLLSIEGIVLNETNQKKIEQERLIQAQQDQKAKDEEAMQIKLKLLQTLQETYNKTYGLLINNEDKQLNSAKNASTIIDNVENLLVKLETEIKDGTNNSQSYENTITNMIVQLKQVETDILNELNQQQVKSIQTPPPPSMNIKNVQTISSNQLNPKCIEKYNEFVTLKKEWNSNLLPLLQDASMKSFRFDCQSAVNTSVNAISGTSHDHLKDKYERLKNLITGVPVKLGGDRTLNPQTHPLGLAFCIDILAKKFVNQGSGIIKSKPEQAYSMSLIIASLWIVSGDFGKLFLGHLFESCPYLVPTVIEKSPGQSDEDHFKQLGYKFNAKKELEKDKFISSMSGMARLYAAVTTAPVANELVKSNHPHGIGNIWSWLAIQMTIEPIHDLTATLLYDILEVTGHEMFNSYGNMFAKLLRVLYMEYVPKIKAVTIKEFDGSLCRLESFLKTTIQNLSIKRPPEMLKQGFL